MDTRYWVGGTGTWDESSTTHWSAASGGAGEASVPTSSDNVVFDVNSGGGTCTRSNGDALTLTTTGYTGTITGAALSVYGNVVIGSGTTFSCTVFTAGGGAVSLSGVFSGGLSISGGVSATLAGHLTVNGGAGGLAVGGGNTFSAGAYNVMATNVDNYGTINMGSGVWTMTAATGTVWSNAGGTVSKQTASMVLAGSGAGGRTFAGGGQAYPSLTLQGSAAGQVIDFTGSNTFDALNSSIAVAHTLRFAAGTATTVKAMSNVASAGKLQTIASSSAATASLVYQGSDRISLDYLSVSYSNASPAGAFYAGTHSTNGGNNAGWSFTAPPPRASLFFGGSF